MLIHSKELFMGGSGNKVEKLYRRQMTYSITSGITEYIYYFGKLEHNVNTRCFNKYFPLLGMSGKIGATGSTVSWSTGDFLGTTSFSFFREDSFSDKMPCYLYRYSYVQFISTGKAAFLSPKQEVGDYILGWEFIGANLTDAYFNLNTNGSGTLYTKSTDNQNYSLVIKGEEEEVTDYIYRA